MSDRKFDPSKVEKIDGRLYKIVEFDYGHGIQRTRKSLSEVEEAEYLKWQRSNKAPKININDHTKKRTRGHISEKFKSYFNKDSGLTKSGGWADDWARTMTLKGGKDIKNNFTLRYKDYNGKYKKITNWGAKLSNEKETIGGTTVLNGFADVVKSLDNASHMVRTQAEHFRVLVGKRALVVFQTSFKFQQFHSQGESEWKELEPSTVEKRKRRRHKPSGYNPNRILKEFGDLYNSLKFNERSGTVYTDRIKANPSHYKSGGAVFAGYHNEGEGFYGGHAGSPYIQRQFMGHSTALDPFSDKFLKTMVKRYLFDSVFLYKKSK